MEPAGRPELQSVQTRPAYVAFRMADKDPVSLPKELPSVPNQPPITWLVVVVLCQWEKVTDSLAAHADDTVIITAHPVVASDGTHVL